MSEPRTCPNCGAEESRWTIGGVEHVNLSPISGQCVDCLAAMTKEMGPLAEQAYLFDAREAQAGRDE